MLDLDLDPITRDIIDGTDGGPQEASDSRPAVIWQLEERADEGWMDSGTGSRLGAMLEASEPVTPAELRDEALRALQLLVAEGVIADLTAAVEFAPPDGAVITLSYTDVGTGLRVDELTVPFGGA